MKPKPIPRKIEPYGTHREHDIRVALDREHNFNPAEAAVYIPPDNPVYWARAAQSRISYQVDRATFLLDKYGFDPRARVGPDRGRVEGSRTGRNVLVTIKRRPDGRLKMSYYGTTPPEANRPLRWYVFGSAISIGEYMEGRGWDAMRLHRRPLQSICRCPRDKVKHPTHQEAGRAVRETWASYTRGDIEQPLQGVYRCPYDDRTWHTTSRIDDKVHALSDWLWPWTVAGDVRPYRFHPDQKDPS